jgi:uncharacterized protein with von Willebrand factor type A (vWA) domain
MATDAALARLRIFTKNVAWLNPMPELRWTGTSAATIAHQVPMFTLTRRGLDAAVEVLRGRVVL